MHPPHDAPPSDFMVTPKVNSRLIASSVSFWSARTGDKSANNHGHMMTYVFLLAGY